MIPDCTIKSLAAKNDLQIVEDINLLDYYERERINLKEKFRRIPCVSPELWEISQLYKVMVLQKTSGPDMNFERNWLLYKDAQKKTRMFK